MRKLFPSTLENGRTRSGTYRSNYGSPEGMFHVPGPCATVLRIVSSGGTHPLTEGWEHVSVSCQKRCPNWIEMSFVKDLFWLPEECTIQFHPPKSQYINNAPYCLHIWKPPFELPLPPSILIGLKQNDKSER